MRVEGGDQEVVWRTMYSPESASYGNSDLTNLHLIAVSIYHEYSVGQSIRPISTRCCFKMTNMIQVFSIFH